MEAKLNKISIDCFKAVFSSSFSREETAESVVPDVLPDIYQIIDADGLVLLRSKEVEPGRVSLSGSIDATVIYLPEGEDGVKKLSLNMPFNFTVDAAAVSEASRAVSVLRLGSIDARMLNPRKVLVRADLVTDLFCFDEGEFHMYDGVTGEGNENIQVKKGVLTFSPIKAIKEKTFILSDEFQIPVSKPPLGDILKKQVALITEDVKSVGNKLIFRGIARTSLLYSPIGEEVIASCTFETPFSQILEMENLGEDNQTNIYMMTTGAYFDVVPNAQEGRLIGMELHVVAQAVCFDSATATYISDAYSNTCNTNLSSEAVNLMSIERRSTLRESLRETIETSEPVREVISVCPTLGGTEIIGGKIRCSILVQAIYLSESDKIEKASKRFTVEGSVDVEDGMEVTITDVDFSDAFGAMSAGGLEVRLAADISVNITRRISVTSVTGIETDTENPPDNLKRPSVTIVRSKTKADLWMLAKKYGSTTALISAANDLFEGEESAMHLLLIPRER